MDVIVETLTFTTNKDTLQNYKLTKQLVNREHIIKETIPENLRKAVIKANFFLHLSPYLEANNKQNVKHPAEKRRQSATGALPRPNYGWVYWSAWNNAVWQMISSATCQPVLVFCSSKNTFYFWFDLKIREVRKERYNETKVCKRKTD